MSDYIESYYRDSLREARIEAAPAAGALQADVVVVGGGVTGCAAALSLARRGYDVVLLEAQRIGWGASGRSGGQVLTGFGTEMSTFAAQLGDTAAAAIFEMSREAVRLTARLVAEHAIDCDMREGALYAALKSRHMQAFARERDYLATTFGYTALSLLDDTALAAHVISPHYIGGLFDAESRHLHPLNYVLGLARAARAAGVRIHENSAVTGIQRGTPATVHTATARLRADFVILAGNAYLADDIAPELAGHLMPVGNYIAATAPLDDGQRAATMPGDDAVSDANFVLDYYRLASREDDGRRRLLYGGLVSYGRGDPRRLRLRMQARLARLFPPLAGIDIDYCWGGTVGVTRNRAPQFGRLGTNLYYAQGYSGHGMALAGLAGGLMADAIAGQSERFDLYARITHRRFPGGRALRSPLLWLATTFLRMRDVF